MWTTPPEGAKQGQHVGVPAVGVAGVGLGAFVEEQAHGVGAAVLGGKHEGRAAIGVAGFEVGALGEERFDLFGFASFGGFQNVRWQFGCQDGEYDGEKNCTEAHIFSVERAFEWGT